jgi:hypothetical protein
MRLVASQPARRVLSQKIDISKLFASTVCGRAPITSGAFQKNTVAMPVAFTALPAGDMLDRSLAQDSMPQGE